MLRKKFDIHYSFDAIPYTLSRVKTILELLFIIFIDVRSVKYQLINKYIKYRLSAMIFSSPITIGNRSTSFTYARCGKRAPYYNWSIIYYIVVYIGKWLQHNLLRMHEWCIDPSDRKIRQSFVQYFFIVKHDYTVSMDTV